MKTINGQPVNEGQIDSWVTEAEKGYDVETLRTRGRKPRDNKAAKIVSIRLSPNEIADLDKLSLIHI